MNRDSRIDTSQTRRREQRSGSRISYDARNLHQFMQDNSPKEEVSFSRERQHRLQSRGAGSRASYTRESQTRRSNDEVVRVNRERSSRSSYASQEREGRNASASSGGSYSSRMRSQNSYVPAASRRQPRSDYDGVRRRESDLSAGLSASCGRTGRTRANKEAQTQFDARPLIPEEASLLERVGDVLSSLARLIARNPFGKKAVLAALVAMLIFFGAGRVMEALPISVTVNGKEVSLGGSKDLNELKNMPVSEGFAGNFVGVDGSLITSGGGYPFTATVNGEMLTDYSVPIPANAQIELTRGGNIEEPAEETETHIPFTVQELGTGPVHVISSEGTEGIEVHKLGKITGKEADQTRQEMQPRVYDRRTIDTQGKKVVAFTFDDGPWEEYTAEILDILKENDAHATFFTVGQRIKDKEVDLVKRAYDEGHQVATHTWDHAAGSGQGVNLSFMTKEEQREEIEKGQQAIKDALNLDANRAFRAPGGNFPFKVWKNVEDLISAELGWNVDTFDWKRPGSAAIAKAMMSVSPGDIVLCHDGGGDRSQTVEALREVLPKLKAEGWEFVTIDELLKYPLKETKDPLKPVIEAGAKKEEAKH